MSGRTRNIVREVCSHESRGRTVALRLRAPRVGGYIVGRRRAVDGAWSVQGCRDLALWHTELEDNIKAVADPIQTYSCAHAALAEQKRQIRCDPSPLWDKPTAPCHHHRFGPKCATLGGKCRIVVTFSQTGDRQDLLPSFRHFSLLRLGLPAHPPQIPSPSATNARPTPNSPPFPVFRRAVCSLWPMTPRPVPIQYNCVSLVTNSRQPLA